MSWFADSNNQTENAKAHVTLAIAVDADFPDGHVRLCTWLAPLLINGQTYQAVASFGSVTQNPENNQLTADTRVYRLSGVDPAVIPEAEIDNCFGRSLTEYLVWIDSATRAVIGWEINFEGRMDRVSRVDGDSPAIEVSVENRLVLLDQADGWCYTDQHQQKYFPGDVGMNQVQFAGSVQITWGGGQALFPTPSYILLGAFGATRNSGRP